MCNKKESLKERVMTGAVIAIVICLILSLSGYAWFTKLVATFLSVCAITELYRAVSLDRNRVVYMLSLTLTAILCWIPIPHYFKFTAPLFLLAVFLFVYLMMKIGKTNEISQGILFFVAFLIAFFYRAIPELRMTEHGLYNLTAPILVCTITDAAAYFSGMKFGKHKLAPVVSPKKTIEGCVGGTSAAILLILLLAIIGNQSGTFSVHYGRLMAYTITASFIGQFGDLALSSIKRIVGIKDYGDLLPGHGGILDRFDSMLFVLPFTCMFYSFVGSIIF